MSNNPIAEGRATINDYRNAAFRVFNRIKWDLNPLSYRSRNKLKKLRNSHSREKAVILCNGPSLNKVDFASLKSVFTFGLNKINLLFGNTDFRPSCVVSVNSYVLEQNMDFYKGTDLPLFLDSNFSKVYGNKQNITYLFTGHQIKFARDVSFSIWQGATVTFVALQLAFHMGFKEVALVGCDHNFAVKGNPGELVTSKTKDLSHFNPNYFGKGMKWQLPDLVTNEYAYFLANETYNAFNRKVYNCTDGGKLKIFNRISLAEFVKL